jgi:intein/homing endonuclease
VYEDLAEVLGFLCAEGCYVNSISNYWGFDKRRKTQRYYKNKRQIYIEFANIDLTILSHFRSLLESVYDYSPSIAKDRIRICRRDIIRALLFYTQIDHMYWRVPIAVRGGSSSVKCAFVRGFFEGDGSVSKGYIRFSSANNVGLQAVSSLLFDLGVDHSLNGPYLRKGRKAAYEIYVYQRSKDTFLKKVKPLVKIPA